MVDRAVLTERMIEIANEVQAIAARADARGDGLSAAELNELSTLERQFNEAENQLAGLEKAEAIASRMSKGAGRVSDPAQPGTGVPVARSGEVAAALRRPDLVGRRYGDIWGGSTTGAGVKGFARFLRGLDVRDMSAVPEVYNASGMTVHVGSEGGFLVPAEFARVILDQSLEDEVVRPRALIYPMTSNALTIPALNNGNHSLGAAQVQMQWTAEGGAFTAKKAKLRTINLATKKAGLLVPVTRELIEDSSPAADTVLTRVFAQELARGLDAAFIRGTGAGQPVGVLNAASLVTVSKESGQAATTLVAANVLKMLGRLAPACWGTSAFLAHPSTVPSLLSLSVSLLNQAGTSQQNAEYVPAVMESGQRMSLYGRPVIVSEHCSPLGTVGDLILVDLAQYIVGMRAAMRVDRSDHLYFDSDEVAFRMTIRTDGLPGWDSAVTPVNGSDTLSWAVVVETRS